MRKFYPNWKESCNEKDALRCFHRGSTCRHDERQRPSGRREAWRCLHRPFRGGDSVLQCEHIGKVTIKQIYEKGFRVVHMQDDKNTATYVMLVIEEQ